MALGLALIGAWPLCPGVLLGSLPMLTVALLAWLPPSTLTVG